MNKTERIARDAATRATLPAHEQCADTRCPEPLSTHIGHKSCPPAVKGVTEGSWYHLPMAAAAWRDAR